MAQLPVIRARGQPDLAPVPQANPRALDIGGAVANVGDAMAGLGEELGRLQAANRAKESANRLRAARTEMTLAARKLRAESDVDMRVDGLTDRYRAGSAELRQEFVGRAADPGEAEQLGLIWDEISAGYESGIIQRETEMRAVADRDHLKAHAEDLKAQYAAAPDEASRQSVADQYASMVANAYDSGQISAPERRGFIESFSEATQAGEVTRLLREDPAAGLAALNAGRFTVGPAQAEELRGRFQRAIEAKAAEAEKGAALQQRAAIINGLNGDHPARVLDQIDAGEFDALPPDELARMRATAQAEVANRAAAARRAAADEADAAARERSKKIALAEAALENGRPIPDPVGLTALVANTSDALRVATMLQDSAELAGFARLYPAEREAALTERLSKPPVDKADLRRDRLFSTVNENLRRAEEADIIGHVRDAGLAEVEPVQLGDADSLATRAELARDLAARYELAPDSVRFFSDTERDDLARRLKDASVDDKLVMLGTMAGALGRDAAAPLGEIGMSDPIFGHAGILVAETGSLTAARAALTGQKMLADAPKIAPAVPRKVRDAALREFDIAGALPLDFIGPQARIALVRTADAIFAASWQGEVDDTADGGSGELVAAYRRALQMAAGATWQGEFQLGGIQPVHGGEVLLPARLRAATVETALEEAPDDAWAAASANGTLPEWYGRPIGRAARAQLVPRYVGAGLYEMGYPGDHGMVWLADPGTSEPALIDLEKLVAEARRAGARP